MHKDVYDNEIKNSLDKLNPTEEQSNAMWERLSKALAEKETDNSNTNSNDNSSKVVSFDELESKKKSKKAGKILTRIAATIIVVLVAFGVDKVTGGHVYAAIKDLLNIDQGRQDVVGNFEDDIGEDYNIYAPDIYHMDENMLIFGGLRGIVIYDLENNVVMGNIDTQAINCVYFNSDSKETHIVKDGDKLVVFNSENEKAYGEYYIFGLTDFNGGELTPVETGNDADVINTYYHMWKEVDKTYIHTFDMAEGNQELEGVVNENYTYSERSVVWKNASGKECNSFLIEGDNTYVLYTYNTIDASVTTQEIDLSKVMAEATTEVITDNEKVILTEYVYSGDNKAVEAIYGYMRDDYFEMFMPDLVMIPAYIIYEEVDAGDEYLVFGNFYIYGYRLTGGILEAESGASMPGVAHLKKAQDGYEVIQMEFAGDGEMYDADIKEFTKDYPEIYDKYFEYNPERDQDIRTEYIRNYIMDNNLDIQYYKDYGWDPIKIFE